MPSTQHLACAGTAWENLGRCTKVIFSPARIAFELRSAAVTSIVSATGVIVLRIAMRVTFELDIAHLASL